MSNRNSSKNKFLADRMLGTLARYLRFMGYDTTSASVRQQGNKREDSILLQIAGESNRILLTRDKELAQRGGNMTVLIRSENVLEQVKQLVDMEIVEPVIGVRMQRCSICNNRLRPATDSEIRNTDYAPSIREGIPFFWCTQCHRLYWMGSHGKNLSERLRTYFEKKRA